MSCVIPQNQPIYQALLDKAASYPADKLYQAKAYKNAAESITSYTLNLFEISEIYPDKIPGIARHIEGFIYDFIENNEKKMSTCVIPQNQPIYQALLDKSYTKAAAGIASYTRNLFEISEIYPDKISGVDRNIEGFIYDFIENNEKKTVY
jgi:DNA polymerase/3'-5' exonuclease PolX